MASTFYRRLFPGTRLSPDKQAVNEFMTTEQGFRMSTSVGGVLTGRGAEVIILDDPLKPDEALSATRRTSVNEWYSNTLLSRLNNKETGIIIIVMQGFTRTTWLATYWSRKIGTFYRSLPLPKRTKLILLKVRGVGGCFSASPVKSCNPNVNPNSRSTPFVGRLENMTLPASTSRVRCLWAARS